MAKKQADWAKVEIVGGVYWFRLGDVTRVRERKKDITLFFADGGEPAVFSGKELPQARAMVAAWRQDPKP